MNSVDLSDLIRGMQAIINGLPTTARGVLTKFAFRLQVYQVANMDRQGPPPGVRSTSPRIAIRTGKTVRAITPKGPNNLFQIIATGEELAIEEGINTDDLIYPLFHVFADDFNVPFPQRDWFHPAFDTFEQQEGPKIERELGDEIERLWANS